MDDPSFSDELMNALDAGVGKSIANYEDRAVRRVLDRLGLAQHYRWVASAASTRTTHGLPTFAIADEMIGLPLVFGVSSKLSRVEWVAFPELFGKFTKLPMYEALLDHDETCDPDDARPRAVVFRWGSVSESEPGRRRGISGGTYMVIHDDETAPVTGETRITRLLQRRGQYRPVTIERLDSLLSAWHGHWVPSHLPTD